MGKRENKNAPTEHWWGASMLVAPFEQLHSFHAAAATCIRMRNPQTGISVA
jgi:hypothetical protein